jgi:hypothetical protein
MDWLTITTSDVNEALSSYMDIGIVKFIVVFVLAIALVGYLVHALFDAFGAGVERK